MNIETLLSGKTTAVTALVVEGPLGTKTPYLRVYIPAMGATSSPRILHSVATDGGAVSCPYDPGDEVLVLMVDGDVNKAFVLGRLHNGSVVAPEATSGILVQHPEGAVVRRTDTAQTQALANAQFVNDVKDAWTSLRQNLTLGPVTPVPGDGGAALLVALVAWNAQLVAGMAAFEAQLQQLAERHLTKALESE